MTPEKERKRMPGVQDRVVVVTGAGGGLGREYALALARDGASVVINDASTFGPNTSAIVLNGYATLTPLLNNFMRSNEDLTLNAGSTLNAAGLSSQVGNVTFGGGSQGVSITATTQLQANTVTINPGAVLNLVLSAPPTANKSFTLISSATPINASASPPNSSS